jgi:catechol 2,3-dioxygenase-like lactoylglutathione lyase family enzyme
MAVPARLTVITLGCRDLARQRRFYADLGFREGSNSTDDWAVFRLTGVYLCLYPIESLGAEAAPGEPPPDPGWNGVTLAINVSERDEVDTVYAAAVEAGATPVDPPTDRPYGPRACYVADPEGNRWEIVWAQGATIGDDGLLHGLDES